MNDTTWAMRSVLSRLQQSQCPANIAHCKRVLMRFTLDQHYAMRDEVERFLLALMQIPGLPRTVDRILADPQCQALHLVELCPNPRFLQANLWGREIIQSQAQVWLRKQRLAWEVRETRKPLVRNWAVALFRMQRRRARARRVGFE